MIQTRRHPATTHHGAHRSGLRMPGKLQVIGGWLAWVMKGVLQFPLLHRGVRKGARDFIEQGGAVGVFALAPNRNRDHVVPVVFDGGAGLHAVNLQPALLDQSRELIDVPVDGVGGLQLQRLAVVGLAELLNKRPFGGKCLLRLQSVGVLLLELHEALVDDAALVEDGREREGKRRGGERDKRGGAERVDHATLTLKRWRCVHGDSTAAVSSPCI